MEEEQQQQIEINFRLDRNGRTQPTTATSTDNSNEDDNNRVDTDGKGHGIDGASDGQEEEQKQHDENGSSSVLDYTPKTIQTEFVLISSASGTSKPSDPNEPDGSVDGENNGSDEKHDDNDLYDDTKILDDLLFDCEISDCGLMPRTFWVPATGFKPRFSLEQLAIDVFNHHVKEDVRRNIDMKTSGAEWWAQIRSSPEKTGRYAMFGGQQESSTHKKDENETDDATKDHSKDGISFHWDKDEDLRLLCGGTAYIHPHLSTVTYLTSLGAPTLAVNYRVNNVTGEWITTPPASSSEKDTESDCIEGFVSWPFKGKHLSFDGRYLHAAPGDLMEEGKFEQQCSIPADTGNDNKHDTYLRNRLIRRHRRVTFLVNIWLNYHPFAVEPFPETMIDKMSGNGESPLASLSFDDASDPNQQKKGTAKEVPQISIVMSNGKSLVTDQTSNARDTKSDGEAVLPQKSSAKRFIWPMGDCDSREFIHADMPLEEIRSVSDMGGNIKIKWMNQSDDSQNPTAKTGDCDIELVRKLMNDGKDANSSSSWKRQKTKE